MMDLKNIIDNTKNTKLSYDFNSCQLNFEDKNVQGLTWQDGKDTVDCIQTKNKKDWVKFLTQSFYVFAKSVIRVRLFVTILIFLDFLSLLFFMLS